MGRNRLTSGQRVKVGEAVTLVDEEPGQSEACQAAAAVTTLAREYSRQLALRVIENRLPWGLEAFLEELGDAVAAQVGALGAPDWVPARN